MPTIASIEQAKSRLPDAAVDVLTNLFDVDMIEVGYEMPPGTPKFSASFASRFQLAKILSKPTAPPEPR